MVLNQERGGRWGTLQEGVPTWRGRGCGWEMLANQSGKWSFQADKRTAWEQDKPHPPQPWWDPPHLPDSLERLLRELPPPSLLLFPCLNLHKPPLSIQSPSTPFIHSSSCYCIPPSLHYLLKEKTLFSRTAWVCHAQHNSSKQNEKKKTYDRQALAKLDRASVAAAHSQGEQAPPSRLLEARMCHRERHSVPSLSHPSTVPTGCSKSLLLVEPSAGAGKDIFTLTPLDSTAACFDSAHPMLLMKLCAPSLALTKTLQIHSSRAQGKFHN